MRIRWEYLTIPTIVYIAILLQMNWNAIPKCLGLLVAGYLLFNVYALVIATFSRYGVEYLKVFLPYVFLPAFWRSLEIVFITPFFSLYVFFLISVLYEFIFFERYSFVLLFFRLFAVNLLVWGMHKWLISIWSLF